MIEKFVFTDELGTVLFSRDDLKRAPLVGEKMTIYGIEYKIVKYARTEISVLGKNDIIAYRYILYDAGRMQI